MARFNAAKMLGAIDKKFQDAYNYLIDLLDTGYTVETTISGKKIKVDINAKDGISITIDGVKVFGVDSSGNMFASRIASSSDPENNYAIIGDFPAAGTGIALYDIKKLSTAPFMLISSLDDGSGGYGGFVIVDGTDVDRIYVDHLGNFYVNDKDLNLRFGHEADKSFFAKGGQDDYKTIVGDSSETYMRNPGATNHRVGADATGPFYVKSGVKTYF